MDPSEIARLAEHEEWHWWHRARQAIVRRVLRRFAPAQARILDVGCGTGATSRSLAALGSVLGMDIGREALVRARARGLSVARASAAALPVAPARFDVVVALDVLEHLEDDTGAARQMLAALEPGGILLVTVPAYPFLWSSHDEALSHRRRYLRRSLVSVLERAGFEIELCSYVMSAILPAALLVRLSERWRPPPALPRPSGYQALPAVLNGLLSRLVAIDGWLLRWTALPFGLSLLAVARRPREAARGSARTAA
jgi:SAM-dependent methyltransferase